MKHPIQKPDPLFHIPAVAARELEQVERMDAEFSMDDLVDWVNSAVSRFYPQANEGGDKRVSDHFTVRTLRYYQTLGCLDAPDKDGRRAIYGFRHYLQALLIRKLLYLRFAPEHIHAALIGQTNEQYQDMLFTEIPSPNGHTPRPSPTRNAQANPDTYTRITLTPGMELHIQHLSCTLSENTKHRILKLIQQEIQNP
jgi:DNA-binding transcriptional MerR regulator